MKKKITKKLAKFQEHMKNCGYSAVYDDWFEGILITVSTISLDSLREEINGRGFRTWIKPAPELGRFPTCNDPTLSGRDMAAYLMVK